MKLKRDPYFTFVAVLFLAGLILAFVDPTPDAAKDSVATAASTSRLGGHSS